MCIRDRYILYRRKNLLYSYIGGLKYTKAPIFCILVVHAVSVAEAKYFSEGLMLVHVVCQPLLSYALKNYMQVPLYPLPCFYIKKILIHILREKPPIKSP